MNPTYKGSVRSLRDFWENRSASFEKDYGIRQKGIIELARQTAEFIKAGLFSTSGAVQESSPVDHKTFAMSTAGFSR